MSARSDQTDFLSYYELGTDLSDQGRWDEAVVAYHKALEINPSCADAYHLLGHALRSMGKLDEAIDAYQTAIEVNPYLPLPFCDLGNALRERGRLDEAIAAYQTAIGIHPGHPLACNNLGSALSRMGALDAAVALFWKVISSNPRYADAYSNLGDALQAQGNVIKAITIYREAIELDPHHPLAHSNLCEALNRLRRRSGRRTGGARDPRTTALLECLGVEEWQVLADSSDHECYEVIPVLTHEQVADPCYMPSPARYSVLTEADATARAVEYIRNNIWSLDAEFLLRHVRHRHPDAAQEILRTLYRRRGSNDFLKDVIQDLDALVTDALATYGRGRFLADDWREQCCRGHCIYSQN